MKAGTLRHRVTFQRATETDSGTGSVVKAWANLDTVWARVEPLAGKERFAAMQTQADVDYRILCRYQSALSDMMPNDRATWNGITFDIKSVINTDGRNIELQVFARRHI
jgi:SPP1 family predicted phage head-tail adaptor